MPLRMRKTRLSGTGDFKENLLQAQKQNTEK